MPGPGMPQPFGRYLLVEKIASGGMAEVFRAVLRGADGFEKPIAIKRILPVFVEDADLLTLFKDEARIASTLAHANIAQVFEFGEVDGTYYLTLELVEGMDLGRLASRMKGARQPMPLPTAAFIVAEAARGLGYAHDKTDGAGQRIGIVHRDISPANILLSRAGEVKVADFGIAKAAGKVHKTETGVLMGKLRYMSPEQVAGEPPLDGRSDIFSLGVVLYELLAGQPLWPSEASLRLPELIQKAEIHPPSSRNPSVPPELDAIVMKALARPLDQRYARASDLARDLSRYISTAAPGFSREDLGALVVSHAPPPPAALAVDLANTEVARPAQRPETLPVGRRRLSASTWIGLGLFGVILASGGMVLIRFVWPSGENLKPPDAARLVDAVDAGPRAPDPVPTAEFSLLPTATRDEKTALLGAVDRFEVTRSGLPSPAYAAFLTGLDDAIADLALDAEGHALPAGAGSPLVAALVERAGVGEAVAAVVAYVRATGELPQSVRSGVRNFLAGRPSSQTQRTADRGGFVDPYVASFLAVWLDAGNRTRLVELAYANDALDRWCEPIPAPGRHFAAVGCERPALVAALRKASPKDASADGLERWAQAAGEIAAPDGGTLSVVHVEYRDVTNPTDLALVVQLSGLPAGEVTVAAAGLAPRPLVEAEDGAMSVVVPRKLLAPVLRIGGAVLRLPAPPFAR